MAATLAACAGERADRRGSCRGRDRRRSRRRATGRPACCCRLRWFSSSRSRIDRPAPPARTGLVRKCSAPSLIAWTARSIEPCAGQDRPRAPRGRSSLKRGQQLERVAVRQRVVDDRDVRRAPCGTRSCGLAQALGLVHVVALRLEEVAERRSGPPARRRRAGPGRRTGLVIGRPRPGPRSGSRTVTTAPPSGRLPAADPRRRAPRRCAGRSTGRGRCRRGAA